MRLRPAGLAAIPTNFVLIWPLIFAVMLAGCGSSMWSDRGTNPVITDLQKPNFGLFDKAYYAVISTTAGRRSIFVAYRNPKGDLLERPAICAEPPPDAIDAYTNALGLAASAGKTSGASPELELSRTLAVSSGLGLYRSQGLQLLRDREFQLCIMHLREIIDDQQFVCLQQQTVSLAAELIDREMSAIEMAAGRPGLVVAAPSPPGVTLPPLSGGGAQGAADNGAGNKTKAQNASAANQAGGGQAAGSGSATDSDIKQDATTAGGGRGPNKFNASGQTTKGTNNGVGKSARPLSYVALPECKPAPKRLMGNG